MSLFQLEVRRLLLEYRALKDSIELKNDIIKEITILFNKALAVYLEHDSTLKEKWCLVQEEREKALIEALNDSEKTLEGNKPTEDSNTLIKPLYREVVKKTHPDKLLNFPKEYHANLVKIYQLTTQAYEANSLPDILYWADQLKIPFEITEEDFTKLKKVIIKTSAEDKLLEQTYPWRWYYSLDENKDKILKQFIKAQID